MSKVSFFDRRVRKIFLEKSSLVSGAVSVAVIFFDIPTDLKVCAAIAFLVFLASIYVSIWIHSDQLDSIKIDVEGSSVLIKAGDLFQEPDLKVIAFNEYFDTQVDDVVISRQTLNGIFLTKHLDVTIPELDKHIESFPFSDDALLDENTGRRLGKTKRFRLGTVCTYKDFLLVAFAKFDNENRATLTMPEYLEFLINFWDRVNSVYALKSVSVPIFGSGITRIKGHKSVSDEDLLKIMLWTFRISEMRFKYPAKLTIVIHKDKIDQINLLDIRSVKNGV
jgi:hypothetical protein